MSSKPIAAITLNDRPGSLLLGTGLAFASLILVPAFATSIGLGPSLTGSLRMALMKASNRVISAGGPRTSTPRASNER